MILIIDSNVLLSGLIRNGGTRALLIDSPFELCAPETLVNEVRKYKEYILKKSGLSDEEFEILFSLLMEVVRIIPMDSYVGYIGEAEKIIGDVDKNDVVFVALALSFINDGIWSDDNDFLKQDRIRIYKTGELIRNYLR